MLRLLQTSLEPVFSVERNKYNIIVIARACVIGPHLKAKNENCFQSYPTGKRAFIELKMPTVSHL
jgi:hypothetical protein